MDLGLKGKVAFVAAASKGMGKACALGLAAEGARVAMCARGEADLKAAAAEVERKTGAEVLGVPADLSKAEDCARAVARARDAWGGVDVLVANVGGPPPGPFEKMSDAQWVQAFEQVHLSTVRLIRDVLPGMKGKRWGRILAIQSTSVKQPVDGLVLSNGIRPAIAGLFKTLAVDLAKDGDQSDKVVRNIGIVRVSITTREMESIVLGIAGPEAAPRSLFIDGDGIIVAAPFVVARIDKDALDGQAQIEK